jgi:hypothetical protein
MEPWAILVLSLLAVLILGGFSAGLLPALFRNRWTAGRSQDESLETKAERLHHMVHPDEDALD